MIMCGMIGISYYYYLIQIGIPDTGALFRQSITVLIVGSIMCLFSLFRNMGNRKLKRGIEAQMSENKTKRWLDNSDEDVSDSSNEFQLSL